MADGAVNVAFFLGSDHKTAQTGFQFVFHEKPPFKFQFIVLVINNTTVGKGYGLSAQVAVL